MIPIIRNQTEFLYVDELQHDDIEVPERPSSYHEWDGEKWVLNLTEARASQKKKIKESMMYELTETAHILSATIGIEIDARMKDETNISANISIMEADGLSQDYYVGYSEIKPNVTLVQFKACLVEIQKHGKSLYQKKWMLEQQIDAAMTLDDIEAIAW